MVCLSSVVCNPPPPPFHLSAGVVEPSTQFSKKEGVFAGSQFLVGAAWKEEGDFFSGGLQFFNNKLKSEIFNGKKVYKQKCFSLS